VADRSKSYDGVTTKRHRFRLLTPSFEWETRVEEDPEFDFETDVDQAPEFATATDVDEAPGFETEARV
jgi:hypothetical protein